MFALFKEVCKSFLVDFIVFLRKSSAGAELVSHFPNKPCECVMEREWLGIK